MDDWVNENTWPKIVTILVGAALVLLVTLIVAIAVTDRNHSSNKTKEVTACVTHGRQWIAGNCI